MDKWRLVGRKARRTCKVGRYYLLAASARIRLGERHICRHSYGIGEAHRSPLAR